MRFAGQIRVPEIDHPGVPATFVVDDNQAEVILEGESLGRWSLFDVHVTRLVSSAFQVDLGGEEITFLAEEPVDFAYKGVEHMAEVWARYKTMTMPRRMVAVKRSRKGTSPSRLDEFRAAMVENLETERRGTRGTGESSMLAGESASTPEPPPLVTPLLETATESQDTADAVIPLVAGSDEVDRASAEAEIAAIERVKADSKEAAAIEKERLAEAERMAAERQALAEERAVLEEQKQSLEQALAKAERLEKERLDAAQLDMERIEGEKKALEERHEKERVEAERLEAERRQLQELEVERVERERQQAEHLAARQQEIEKLEVEKRAETERLERELQELVKLEAERVESERLESERLEAERLELEKAEHDRAEASRLELERLEKERLELDRLELERQKREKDEAERAEKVRLKNEKREQKRLAKEQAAAAKAAAATPAADTPVDDDVEPVGQVEEVLGTSAEGDLPENAKELVVDLGVLEEAQGPTSAAEAEPALAGAVEKSGIMGAVRSAFTRNSKNHVHDFTEAPGGIGMVRYICRECGYVSISSSD